MNRTLRAIVPFAAAVVLLLSTYSPAVANTTGNVWVCSAALCGDEVLTAGGVGIIHNNDGVYSKDLYDVILSPGQNYKSTTGWSSIAGFYVGAGYCVFTDVRRPGGPWETGIVYQGYPDSRGQKWFPSPDNKDYRLTSFRC